jgi:CTP synthase
VPVEAVIEEKDKDFSIYEVPLSLVENKLDEQIVRKLSLTKAGPLNLDSWRDLIHRLRNPESEITIAVVGKYAEHKDAYKSIYEAIDHAGVHNRAQISIQRIHSETVEREGPERLLSAVDGILVPGGFGERGIEGKIDAVKFARQRGIPYFGICLGMQCAVAEFGRNVAGLDHANSTEFDKDTPHPVICLLDEQKTITDKGGTMRLGAQPAKLAPGSRAAAAYGKEEITERHRHRYEFNNHYRQQYADRGMQVVGTSPDGSLVEIVEIPDHPWFVGVQYHPEFKSGPTRPHPLFKAFIAAAVQRRKTRDQGTGDRG